MASGAMAEPSELISSRPWIIGTRASAGARSADSFAPTLIAFAPGLVFFTVHYLLLRGYYALERNRTVFYVQCAVAATNIVLALVFVHLTDAQGTAPALALAYGASYLVGASVSFVWLDRHLGGLDIARTVRFLVRLAIACSIAGLVAFGFHRGVTALLPDGGPILALIVAGVVVTLALGIFLALARVMRIREADELTGFVLSRVRRSA